VNAEPRLYLLGIEIEVKNRLAAAAQFHAWCFLRRSGVSRNGGSNSRAKNLRLIELRLSGVGAYDHNSRECLAGSPHKAAATQLAIAGILVQE
jgi:hypothetical protein